MRHRTEWGPGRLLVPLIEFVQARVLVRIPAFFIILTLLYYKYQPRWCRGVSRGVGVELAWGVEVSSWCRGLVSCPMDGRKNTPLLCLTLGMASLGVSWVGHLRVCNSHGGSASGRASEARGCPFAGRDRHGDPLHTDQCFWRLLLALCAIATPEAVLGEWVAMLLRQWIEPLRKLHR